MTETYEAKTEREERAERKAQKRAREGADVATTENAAVKTRARAEAAPAAVMEEDAPDGAQATAALRKLAVKEVMARCKDIVTGLMRRTCEGDMRCAKLLFELADIRPGSKDEQKRKLLESAAELLALEPEWEEQGLGNE